MNGKTFLIGNKIQTHGEQAKQNKTAKKKKWVCLSNSFNTQKCKTEFIIVPLCINKEQKTETEIVR